MNLLLNASKGQLERMSPPTGSLPRWFAAPIAAADPGLSISRDPRTTLRSLVDPAAMRSAMVFNVGMLEAIASAIPLRRTRLVSLHQWWPPELLPAWKRAIYANVLGNSRMILTYSCQDETLLRKRFPGADIRWIGHFVDTEFFRPSDNPRWTGDYILCPGDHRRLEHVVTGVAETLGTKIIRFSTDPRVLAYHEAHSSAYVQCLGNIPFTEVRELYQSAKIVLNAVDDRHWPVGITTFCEALSTNRPVVTSAGHSCSGYEFEDGTRPYLTVENIFDVSDWTNAVCRALELDGKWPQSRSPRDLAQRICSFETMTSTWKSVIRDAESSN